VKRGWSDHRTVTCLGCGSGSGLKSLSEARDCQPCVGRCAGRVERSHVAWLGVGCSAETDHKSRAGR